MEANRMPRITKDFIERMQLVRRDIGNLLFHFTKTPYQEVIIKTGSLTRYAGKTARSVLDKILVEGKLLGTSNWIKDGYKCICFTEAPISELAALFSLVKIAASRDQRPMYEPYGIAVKKSWFYKKGGKPVIYDNSSVYDDLPKDLKYRHVSYDPENNIDFTWEREWRISVDELTLDPAQTLVVVPDAVTAFDIMYGFAEEKPDVDYSDGQAWVAGVYHDPKWMAVSLDLFGIEEKEVIGEI